MPDSGEIFLPAAMTKKQLYVLYLEDFKNQKPLKKTQFYFMWRECFPEVKVSKVV